LIGFILVEVKTGRIPTTMKGLRGKVPKIKEIYAITGSYDIIMKISVEDLLGFKKVLDIIHKMEGVSKTLSCIALP